MMNPAEFANIAAAERDLWWYRGMKQILFAMLDPIARAHRFERVLEAGCGTGHLSDTIAERYGWNMTPLDADAAGLAYASQSGLTRLVQGTITALPFRAESFDALLSIDVIPHLDRGREHLAFAEFARVLKPGGLLVIRAAAFDALRSRHSEFVNEVQRFTKLQLSACAQRAGLRVERATYANSLLLPIAAFKFRVWEPLTRQAPASGVEPVHPWLDSLLYAPLRMEAALIAAGRSLPVGQSVILIARRSTAKESAAKELDAHRVKPVILS
jgi:ubiquinone/menaquinone biosynthesis C-methylase UbiE